MLKFVTAALKNRDEEKGFSLVEIIVVVAILGILVIVAIPIYGAIQETARHNAHEAQVANAATVVAAAMANGESVQQAIDKLNSTIDTSEYLYTTFGVVYDPSGLGPAPFSKDADKIANGEPFYVYLEHGSADYFEVAGAGTAAAPWNSWS